MSVESVAIALHHSRAKGTAKIVLVGIANHDGDGGAWPSVATLAKYANVSSVRNVQKAIAELEKLGEVKRHVGAGGTAATPDHSRPNLYEFRLTCPANCDRSKEHRTRNQLPAFDPPSQTTPPVASDTGPPSQTTPEPSLNHPYTPTEISSLGNRATCARGHELIDDRHCGYGCPPEEVAS